MSVLNPLISLVYTSRLRAIDHFRRHAAEVQHQQFRKLIEPGSHTEYLARYGVDSASSLEQFQANVPIVDYDALQHDIERVRAGETDLLWPGRTSWFARSSGTTADRSKYIPVTDSSLADCHYRGGYDVIALFADNYPKSAAFTGKTLTLGGSHQIDTMSQSSQSGDLSAILIHRAPSWATLRREPSMEVALISDFEAKVEAICASCTKKNVTSFAGVPSWNLVMMNRILEYTGVDNLHQVWPRMSLFIHGGVSFTPYREQYERLFPSDRMAYMETYNASEGFFAMQDDPHSNDMLLMLDYGVFYEFIPTRHLDDPTKAVPIEGVTTGVNYAMIITTNSGLWRYMIGDTVEFTSLSPYKIRITGRTKSYINAFGEEIIVDNAEAALRAATSATASKIAEYTAAPIYMDKGGKGSHQWVIEFEDEPSDIQLFAKVLDQALCNVNSDYAAKRDRDTTLTPPVVVVAPRGSFYRWMESRGKLGGQNKVPRLSNTRTLIEDFMRVNDLGG